MTPVRRISAGLPPLAWALLLAGAALHLALANVVELSPDEAHYALYGARPDWSYYDHPPLVGWLQWVFVQVGGGDVAMRIVPMASWLVTVGFSVAALRVLPLAPTLDDDAAQARQRDAWVVALLVLSPLLDLLGLALVPDSLLMPMVPATMLACWRLRSPEAARRPVAWLPLGLALGLAVLSKYTAVFLVLGALVALGRFHGAKLPRHGGFWLVTAMLVLAAAPVVVWNVQHHWSSVSYQAGHAAGQQSWKAIGFVRALLAQCFMYGPLLAVCAAWGLRRGDLAVAAAPWRDVRLMVLAFALPVWLTAMALAGRENSLPHWTACGWVALVPAAAVGVQALSRGWRRGLVAWQVVFLGALLGVVVAGGLHGETGEAATAAPGAEPPGKRPNPIGDLYGWSGAAAHAADLARQRGVASISVMNWSLASRIAWYARPWPVHVVNDRKDQFTLWFGPLAKGESTLLVDWSQMTFAPPQGPGAFARCTLLEQTPVVRGGRQIAHFNFSLCERWQQP